MTEDQINGEIPYKVGYLKHDLYEFNPDVEMYHEMMRGTFSLKQIEQYLENCKNKIMDKGTKFICFKDSDGDFWYDSTGYGIEEMDEKWAQEHLERFELI